MLKVVAEKRDIFRKGLRCPRKEGKLPVVVYGSGKAAEHFFINQNEFVKLWKEAGETSVISFDTNNESRDVLIQSAAFDPVKGLPLHVDFLIIDKNKKRKVYVPLEFIGQSQAVKSGAALIKVLHEIEIEALPKDIPQHIEADISVLEKLDDQILVKNLKVPEAVTLLVNPEDVVALVSESKEEEEEVAPVDISQIEVEKKGKKEEDGGAATDESKTPPQKQ